MDNFQVTCWCSAYNFPHRLGGGRCSGDEWTTYVRFHDSDCCEYCSSKTEYGCEISDGTEELSLCEKVLELNRSEEYTKYPADIE